MITRIIIVLTLSVIALLWILFPLYIFIVCTLGVVYLTYECYTAPYVDEQGVLIKELK